MNDKTKIIERIKKLLALSTSPNEHEAALAAEKAQELLAAYNIDMTEVEAGQQETEITRDAVETKSQAWERYIRVATARMYFCEYYYQRVRRPAPQRQKGFIPMDIHFYIGEPHNVAVAKLMSEYLVGATRRLANEGAQSMPKRERSRYRKSFLNSCAARLSQRIYDRIKKMRESPTTTSDGRNLPALTSLYDQAHRRNRDWLSGKVALTSMKSRTRSSHMAGREDGRSAGDRISLDQQVGGRGQAKHLLR